MTDLFDLLSDADRIVATDLYPARCRTIVADLATALKALSLELDEAREENRWAYIQAALDDREAAAETALAAMTEREGEATFYIDSEFDGHNGPLLSIAMVREDGRSIHVATWADAQDHWVKANVVPILDSHRADIHGTTGADSVGKMLRGFIGDCQNPTIIADSPVDIARFCRAISTGEDGGWHSTGYEGMTFIVRNVDCYPTALTGAVQHNAWWDAMALRAALQHKDATHGPE